ncbi:acetyl-CoA carboxylase biotin carboxylase subunit family protein [Gordonia sp. NPDC058843]|uniref:ATP-grasp domain-containing protein n=1 Tax=Gordonia sp. NPDC058843 TaxID=3346648 RepID=UPI0036AB035C
MSRHVVVLHRWATPYALYENYIDHTVDRVSYITTPTGAAGVPSGAAAMRIVAATDDPDEAEAALRSLEIAHGGADAVIALKEDDLLVAAGLRARRGLPGWSADDLRVFRDKMAMAKAVATTGERLPAFAAVESWRDIEEFGRSHGWPVVLKPRFGSSSAGVIVVREDEPAGLDLGTRVAELGPHFVQTLATGTLLHVDGVHAEGSLPVWRVHRYLNTPLGFRSGGWVGSVEVDDPATLRLVHDHALKIVTRLARGRSTVFHLETFLSTGESGPRCTFLEVGARVGGAEIPFLWRDIHGHDLMETAFRLALGERVTPDPVDEVHAPRELGGLLLVAAPTQRPCEITAATAALGTDWAPPELYGENVVSVGDIISDADAYYEHVGGRFRFRGHDAAAIASAIDQVAVRMRLTGRPVAPSQPEGVLT